MTAHRTLLGIACLWLGSVTGCEQPSPQGGVLSGECETGAGWCVDGRTKQECVEGLWGAPAECPPETLESDGGMEVEIRTYCNDGLCRPGG